MRQGFRKVDDFCLQRLAAREGQQLTGQLLAAFDRGGDHLERQAQTPLRDGSSDLLGCAVDDHQEVVEVVRHAARELSDRLHSL